VLDGGCSEVGILSQGMPEIQFPELEVFFFLRLFPGNVPGCSIVAEPDQRLSRGVTMLPGYFFEKSQFPFAEQVGIKG
jgi:hypothetical protein